MYLAELNTFNPFCMNNVCRVQWVDLKKYYLPRPSKKGEHLHRPLGFLRTMSPDVKRFLKLTIEWRLLSRPSAPRRNPAPINSNIDSGQCRGEHTAGRLLHPCTESEYVGVWNNLRLSFREYRFPKCLPLFCAPFSLPSSPKNTLHFSTLIERCSSIIFFLVSLTPHRNLVLIILMSYF